MQSLAAATRHSAIGPRASSGSQKLPLSVRVRICLGEVGDTPALFRNSPGPPLGAQVSQRLSLSQSTCFALHPIASAGSKVPGHVRRTGPVFPRNCHRG